MVPGREDFEHKQASSTGGFLHVSAPPKCAAPSFCRGAAAAPNPRRLTLSSSSARGLPKRQPRKQPLWGQKGYRAGAAAADPTQARGSTFWWKHLKMKKASRARSLLVLKSSLPAPLDLPGPLDLLHPLPQNRSPAAKLVHVQRFNQKGW